MADEFTDKPGVCFRGGCVTHRLAYKSGPHECAHCAGIAEEQEKARNRQRRGKTGKEWTRP